MTPLPVCRWRDLPEGRDDGTCRCTSPKLVGDKERIPLEFCATRCPKHYVDHEPEPEPAPSPQEPGLVTKAANALRAAGRAIAAGVPMVTAEQHAARLQICHGCDQYNAAKDNCAKCGCWLAAKARLATEDCPLAKWPPLPPPA